MSSEKPTGNVQIGNQVSLDSNTKLFYYNGKIIEHKQIIEISKCSYVQQVNIKNYFTSTQDQKLIKVTQIRIEHQLMKITDIIQITDQVESNCYKSIQCNDSTIQCQSNSNNSLEKESKKLNLDQYRLPHLNSKNTKNAIKNLIRIFISWLRQNGYKYEIIELIQRMIFRYKYKTRLIYELFTNEVIRDYFIRFGTNDGQQYINTSKIIDKHIHIKILKQYLSILINLQGNLIIKNGQVSIIQKQLHHSKNNNPSQPIL